MTEKSMHLGDGAYVRYESDFSIILYTSDGLMERNHVVLELPMVKALYDFVEKVRQS